MEIKIQSKHLKIFGGALLAAALVFSTVTSALYWRWRSLADEVFAVMEFDLHSRREEISRKYQEFVNAQQKTEENSASKQSK